MVMVVLSCSYCCLDLRSNFLLLVCLEMLLLVNVSQMMVDIHPTDVGEGTSFSQMLVDVHPGGSWRGAVTQLGASIWSWV